MNYGTTIFSSIHTNFIALVFNLIISKKRNVTGTFPYIFGGFKDKWEEESTWTKSGRTMRRESGTIRRKEGNSGLGLCHLNCSRGADQSLTLRLD